MKKALLLITGAFLLSLSYYSSAHAQELKDLEKSSPAERNVWEFQNEKMHMQVFAKKEPWSADNAEILAELLGFDVTKKSSRVHFPKLETYRNVVNPLAPLTVFKHGVKEARGI